MKTNPKYRFHPIIILYYMRSILIFGILPLIRWILSALSSSPMSWSAGLYVDMFILIIITAYAITRWQSSYYQIHNNEIIIKEGVFFRHKTSLEWSKVTTFILSEPFYLSIFGAAIIRADTIGGSYKNSDIVLCVPRRQLEMLESSMVSKKHSLVSEKEFKPKLSTVLYFALVSTNNMAGMFYIVAFISQSGRLLGREFSDIIVGSFETLARALSQYIPPATAAITYLLFTAWFIGVVFTLSKYFKYQVIINKNTINISGGFLSRQTHIIDKHFANYLSIQQNIVAYFLGLYSLYISSIGCGKERTDITCIIPSEDKATFYKTIDRIFPDFPRPALTIRPSRLGFVRFLSLPFLCCAVVVSTTIVLCTKIPSWTSFISFIGVMLFILSLCYFIMSFIDYRTSGIGSSNETMSMRYSTGFTLHTLYIPADRIVNIKIRQSPFQRITGRANIYIYTVSEKVKSHKCRNVSLNETTALFHSNIPQVFS